MSENLLINTNVQKRWSPSRQLDIQEEEASDFSSSPSIPEEDVDFSLVYTLHTFEATVDGQASVKKGDSLCLLDDSNSYWWLIKDLKTLEIGYIPAENIETPYERLARLNKHRNLEMTSQAGYYTDKEKKKRRGTKKVTLSTSIHFQLQVLLTGEEDEVEETLYETWSSDISEIQESEDDTSSQHTLTEQDHSPSHVLRVYAGNLNVGASYHSIRLTENTSAAELLSRTMDKFHIPQIDVHHQRNSIEYYLSIKNREGEEITLRSEDRPYRMYQTMNAHLTTPMPRLSEQFKLTSSLKPKKIHQTQFLLHKRIKRRGDGGIVHIRLSLLAQMLDTNCSFHSWLTKKKKKMGPERIDKLVAVDGALNVTQLTTVAFEKFHIIPHESQKYRLLLHTKTRDVLLNSQLILSDILKGISDDEEKQFILHNFSSPQATINNHRKVFPEANQPIQVAVTVDRVTQTILKRVDVALSKHQDPIPEGKFTMSISRNDQGGIDIHLPHGLIRSCQLGQNMQYSLMTSTNSPPLIQSILRESGQEEDESNVSTKELETLIQYGSHYLDSLENKYSQRLNTVN